MARQGASVRRLRRRSRAASDPPPRRARRSAPSSAARLRCTSGTSRTPVSPAAPRRDVAGHRERPGSRSWRAARRWAAGSTTAVRVSGGGQSARSARRSSRSSGSPSRRRPTEALEVLLAHPSGGGQLVGVAGDARRRQLVDVGEDQLGEPGDGRRVHPPVDHLGRQLPPRHPGADPVGGEERVDRPPGARLAPSERVGRLDRRRQRLGGVGVLALGGQAQEGAEGHLHRALDAGGHLGAEVGPAVGGHLVGERVDGPLGHRRQRLPERRDHRRLQPHAGSSLFATNKE